MDFELPKELEEKENLDENKFKDIFVKICQSDAKGVYRN